MSERQAHERALLRAQHAQRLLADPMLVEAFAEVEKALSEAWKGTGEAQERERERLWLMLTLLRRVKKHFESAVEDGKVAEMRLKELTALKDRRGIFSR